MLTFNLLGGDFAHSVGGGGKVAGIDPSGLRVKVHQAKRLEQLWQFDKDLIRATPKYLGQDHPSQMINRMPHPALVCFALHETPHFVQF